MMKKARIYQVMKNHKNNLSLQFTDFHHQVQIGKNMINLVKKPDQSGPSKFDAAVILIIIFMVGLAGFGLLKHYNVVIPEKPIENNVRVSPQLVHPKESVVQDVFNKISEGLQNLGQDKVVKQIPKEDEKTLDEVLDNYLSKIEQYTLKNSLDQQNQCFNAYKPIFKQKSINITQILQYSQIYQRNQMLNCKNFILYSHNQYLLILLKMLKNYMKK
ncbi:unnamed protein product [Paramecium sonneborni]|uniref:Transmembrane protein n=1 Tax=Paramecium sonneborni TaxID=65129 RepID=A0A8S1RWZ0_9CILI|nr:unnamed protein product [Paramecium sonneborni]